MPQIILEMSEIWSRALFQQQSMRAAHRLLQHMQQMLLRPVQHQSGCTSAQLTQQWKLRLQAPRPQMQHRRQRPPQHSPQPPAQQAMT